MDEKPKRLTGSVLAEFLGSLAITRVEPVGRSSASGERADEAHLDELLKKGDPLTPGPGKVAEDAATLERLFKAAGESACFGLTPDGHLNSNQPISFDPAVATEQVIRLLEVDIGADDREEALASTWLGLAYHDHDHPADFAGLVRDAAGDGQPKCCYVDVKGTKALSPGGQRSKLEDRAQQRKFGCLAQTVTTAANNGFAGYPGHGKPGLMATLLHNPVTAGKTHAGFAMGWFFDIRSNYQASAALWGWGGALGVKLPEELRRQLESSQETIHGQPTNLLELLREYRDYHQFKTAEGEWDRERLRSTLLAMHVAARYLLMREDPEQYAEESAENLQPTGVETPLTPEDFHPGESWGTYFGKKADAAIRNLRQAEEAKRKVEEDKRKAEDDKRKAEDDKRKAEDDKRKAEDDKRRAEDDKRRAEDDKRKAEDDKRKAEERVRMMVIRRRQRGHGDAEIAEDLGCTVEELLDRYPLQT